eukprot:5557196-Prymnesium_polylepis.2
MSQIAKADELIYSLLRDRTMCGPLSMDKIMVERKIFSDKTFKAFLDKGMAYRALDYLHPFLFKLHDKSLQDGEELLPSFWTLHDRLIFRAACDAKELDEDALAGVSARCLRHNAQIFQGLLFSSGMGSVLSAGAASAFLDHPQPDEFLKALGEVDDADFQAARDRGRQLDAMAEEARLDELETYTHRAVEKAKELEL